VFRANFARNAANRSEISPRQQTGRRIDPNRSVPVSVLAPTARHDTVFAEMERAGASRVVSPYLLGGRRMAEVLKRPTVVDFIDIAMANRHLGLLMEEAQLGPQSPLVGKTLVESNLRRDYGVIIVAIKKASGRMIFNPMPNEKLDAADVIVAIGKQPDLERMREVR
jgi:voltage-gated potassium channel